MAEGMNLIPRIHRWACCRPGSPGVGSEFSVEAFQTFAFIVIGSVLGLSQSRYSDHPVWGIHACMHASGAFACVFFDSSGSSMMTGWQTAVQACALVNARLV